MNANDIATAIKAFQEEEVNYEHQTELTSTSSWFNTYGSNKRRAEKVLLNTFNKFPYTIIRLAVIQGENVPAGRTNYWAQKILKVIP